MEICNYTELLIVGFVLIYLCGIVTGMYFASQIDEDINKRLK